MDPRALLQSADELLRTGDETAARDAYRRTAAAARAAFAPEVEARAMLSLGLLLSASDELDAARSALEEAVARAMESGEPMVEADAHLALAHAHFDAGQSKDGHDELLEAMVLYRRMDTVDARRKLARATRVYGEHLGVLGSEADARQALELAKLMFLELGDREAAAGIDEELERIREYER